MSRKSWSKKSTLVVLRTCVTAATGVLLWLYPPAQGLTVWVIFPWLMYLLTTAIYVGLPIGVYSFRRFDLAFVAIELALLGTFFAVYRDAQSWLFYPLFLLMVLLAGLARRLLWAILLGVAVAATHLLVNLGLPGADPGVLILQVAILLTTAGIVGYLTEELDREEETTDLLDNALEISNLLASALEPQEVYDRLTEVVARLFRADRVAVILTGPQAGVARVVAAVDDGRKIHDLQIDLNEYPEIQDALKERKPVAIDRATNDPRLAEIRSRLPESVRDACFLLTPILHGETSRGVVLVRLDDVRRTFTAHEIKFSRLMGEVAAQALERAEHFAEVSEAARRDGLTGLLNVRAFYRHLGEEIARSERTGASCSLLMLDVDYLKSVNDLYGHQAGDQVLRNIAAALLEEVRQIDATARYGGEEFSVLLPETGIERALVVAERLRARIEQTSHEGVEEAVTVSIGVATYPEDAISARDLVNRADQALYRSKDMGRNRVARFEADFQLDASGISEPLRVRPHDSQVARAVHAALGNLESNRQILRHVDVIASLVTTMRARDPAALTDLQNVSRLAELLLAHLPVDERQRWTIHVACLLRDIGKVVIDDTILKKRDFLTREEYEAVREHSVVGSRIVEPLRGLDIIVPLIRHHHERWDGTGYPDGLRGIAIPYGARVVGIVDAFYAMIRPRSYRSRGLDYAIEEIRRNAGTQFDPELAERLLFVVQSNVDVVASLSGDESEEPGPETGRSAARS